MHSVCCSACHGLTCSPKASASYFDSNSGFSHIVVFYVFAVSAMADKLCMGDMPAAHNPTRSLRHWSHCQRRCLLNAYDVRWGREETIAERETRLQRFRVEKELKKVAANKRHEIRRRCGEEEEGRRHAWQHTTIQKYFLCGAVGAPGHSANNASSQEV